MLQKPMFISRILVVLYLIIGWFMFSEYLLFNLLLKTNYYYHADFGLKVGFCNQNTVSGCPILGLF